MKKIQSVYKINIEELKHHPDLKDHIMNDMLYSFAKEMHKNNLLKLTESDNNLEREYRIIGYVITEEELEGLKIVADSIIKNTKYNETRYYLKQFFNELIGK